jgi:hypothetical protein
MADTAVARALTSHPLSDAGSHRPATRQPTTGRRVDLTIGAADGQQVRTSRGTRPLRPFAPEEQQQPTTDRDLIDGVRQVLERASDL